MRVSYLPMGDAALLINFEQKIDPKINLQVHALSRFIETKEINGILYLTPAYCSLLIAFDKKSVDYKDIVGDIKLLLADNIASNSKPRKLYVPVCYHRDFALDMDEMIVRTNLSAAEIVKRHTAQCYTTYMIGFLPGFPYLGKLPQALECARKPTPRLKVPKGAVGLAGLQTGIYPKESPGGWQIIGNTPVDLVAFNEEHGYLFEAGDEVHFYSISKSKHESIIEDQKNGTFNWTNVYEQAN